MPRVDWNKTNDIITGKIYFDSLILEKLILQNNNNIKCGNMDNEVEANDKVRLFEKSEEMVEKAR